MPRLIEFSHRKYTFNNKQELLPNLMLITHRNLFDKLFYLVSLNNIFCLDYLNVRFSNWLIVSPGS